MMSHSNLIQLIVSKLIHIKNIHFTAIIFPFKTREYALEKKIVKSLELLQTNFLRGTDVYKTIN